MGQQLNLSQKLKGGNRVANHYVLPSDYNSFRLFGYLFDEKVPKKVYLPAPAGFDNKALFYILMLRPDSWVNDQEESYGNPEIFQLTTLNVSQTPNTSLCKLEI